MQQFSQLPRIPRRRRFFRVASFFVRLVSHIIIWDLILGRRFWFRWYADRTRIHRYKRFSRRFRDLALDLGGVMIKLGQFASTRMDILPPAVIEDLIGLQDEVTAVPFALIQATIEAELHQPLNAVFHNFAPIPVAAASFGQVHYANLPNGQPVAIKIQRPQIAELVEIDLSALRWVASWMQYYQPIRKRTDLPALVNEFARITLRELDYLSEADHAERFRHNFINDPQIYVPQIYRASSTTRVLTMERISGIKINDYTALTNAKINRLQLAEKLFLTYLQQCFFDGFFHADPHPGNVFVHPEGAILANNTQPFVLTFLDFGMVDEITPRVMEGLATIASGIVLRDAPKILEGARGIGIIIPQANDRQLRQALEVWLSYTYGKTVRELQNIDVEGFVGSLGELLYDLPFQMPQSLLFLGRALSVVGGVAAGLSPDFDIFATTKPYVLRFIRERNEQLHIREKITTQGREWVTDLAQLPHYANQFYQRAGRGDLQIRPDVSKLERHVVGVEHAVNRFAKVLLASALIIGATILQASGQTAEWMWWAVGGLLLWAILPRWSH